MSVFGDFQRVWLQRFPNSALPAAWEEDVRANLAKHKQKVAVLKEELEKEEFYVEYLERLLSDVEQHKRASKEEICEKVSTISETVKETADSTSVPLKNVSTPSTPDSAEAKPVVTESNNQCSINQCVSELSVGLNRSNSAATQPPNDNLSKLRRNTDPSNFVTVIEVNGLKNKLSDSAEIISARKKVPPKPPPKIPIKREHSLPETDGETTSSETARSKESLISSTEQLAAEVVSHSDSLDSVSPEGDEEPYYDSVAGDPGEYVYIKGGRGSSTDDISSNASTLPLPAPRSHTSSLASVSCEPESPGKSSNYVNIEYFIQKRSGLGDTRSSSDGECDDEDINVPPLLRTISTDTEAQNEEGSYASSSSLDSTTPSTKRKFSRDVDNKVEIEAERMTMYRCIISNIIESETVYVECLNVMIQYMKALRAAVGSSQSVVSEDEYKTIFYKIPELHSLHSEFLERLKKRTANWDGHIGDCFKLMASKLILYGAFLHNYGNATDTVRKCCANNSRFSEIVKNMKCKYVAGQSISLEDLLHKPVARVQKNAMVLHDLLKYTPSNHTDYRALSEALSMTQSFLDEFNQIQTKSMFPATDRAQRRLVKNSFIVELSDGQRKLRHLFLFNDVIACAKYKSSGRNERYTFELKWFIPIGDIMILEECNAEPRENSPANIVALKSQACTVRDQILLEERTAEDKRIRLGSRSEKNRKKLAELEAQLVLASPNLVFRIKNKNAQRTQVFFLSSEFERMQWIDSIQALKMSCTPPAPTASVGMMELQAWITACRTFLKTNMGSYLLRSGRDESLLVGDLHVTIKDFKGLERYEDVYVCIEIDFYGHFFRKAKSKLIVKTKNPVWNESFVIDLEGSENLRILVYSDTEPNPTLLAKHTQKLSRTWLGEQLVEKSIQMNTYIFNMGLKFIPSEVTLRRVPTAKPGALFGAKIQQVCKRQKRDIPFIITACVREVERRGMGEVGIYRVSGSASDLLKMKKSFESNSYEAEQLLKEVDIHSVTGILKLYLRELPEALFTDHLYPQLFEAYNSSNSNQTRRLNLLTECFNKLPEQNLRCINFLLDHLIRVNQHETENKMSLHNLATVFGPTLLRPGGKTDSTKQRDMLAAGTVDVMAQAGILYCFLEDLRARHSKPV